MDIQFDLIELQEVADVFDSLHQTPHYSGFGYPMVRVTDIKGAFLDTSQCLQVSPEIYKEYVKKYLPKRGDIVISRVGSYGITSYVNQESSFCLGQNTAIIVPKINNRYLFYCFQSDYVKNQIEQCVVGSTQKTISLKLIKELKIPCFDLETQHAIARILGSLDDKIELNRQMNETLEAMAKTIFKSWFVDFDPVLAKAEGRDTGLPLEIAALFPDGFEEVEGLEVPRGWRVETLGNVIDLAYGEPLKGENRRGGPIPVYGSNGRIGWHDERLIKGPGIIVGRKGNPGIIHWSVTDFFPIDTTFYVVPKKRDFSLYYLYHELQHQNLPSLGADSAVPGLNRNMAYLSSIVIPS
jgi:type I restriction enzyme, S subunit